METRNASLLHLFVFSSLFAIGVHNAHARGSYALSVDAVNWKDPHQELTIKGKGEPGSMVYLYAGGTDYLLTSLTIDRSGRWDYTVSSPSAVPCTVRAESNRSAAEKETASAPPDCMSAVVSSDSSSGGSTEPSTTNNPPEISGTPGTSVAEGASYSFVPTASDPDGDSLSFGIVNRPAWASFNSATGALSGTPGYSDAGSYDNIQITVTDGSASASLSAFSITVSNVNQSPSITGTPPASVEEGSSYSFVPTASDPDGDSLSFSITNLPVWASFDTTTGQLIGTPGTADVGVYENIVIAASDGTATASLDPVSIAVTETATTSTISATITWVAPVARADGTPLALSEIAGYKIYMGPAADDLTTLVDVNDGSAVEYVVDDLSAETHYFGVTAYDSNGRESALSELIEYSTM
jgi:hypothetical protein